MRSPLRSPAQVEGPQSVLPQPEKALERPPSYITHLENDAFVEIWHPLSRNRNEGKYSLHYRPTFTEPSTALNVPVCDINLHYQAMCLLIFLGSSDLDALKGSDNVLHVFGVPISSKNLTMKQKWVNK